MSESYVFTEAVTIPAGGGQALELEDVPAEPGAGEELLVRFTEDEQVFKVRWRWRRRRLPRGLRRHVRRLKAAARSHTRH